MFSRIPPLALWLTLCVVVAAILALVAIGVASFLGSAR